MRTMPKKKRKGTKKRSATRNPSNPKKKTNRRYTPRGILGGLSFKKALKDLLPIQIGMMSAKWAAKRWGEAATEIDPNSWNWASYLKGALGATLAGLLAGQFKAGAGQKVLEGGVNLMIYKAIQNELIVGSAWATEQFGQDAYFPDEYEGSMLLAGETPEGQAFMLGADNEFYPADDDYRVGNVLEPVGPLGQIPERLEPVGPLGADPYARAFFD